MDLSYLCVKVVMMCERFLTDVKVDFVPRALLEKVKNGVGYLLKMFFRLIIGT
ncbi:hypothetical protein D3C86_2115200 [compost metagenome]